MSICPQGSLAVRASWSGPALPWSRRRALISRCGHRLSFFIAVTPAGAVAGLLRGFDTFARIVRASATNVVVNSIAAAAALVAGIRSAQIGLIVIVSFAMSCIAAQLWSIKAERVRHRPESGEIRQCVSQCFSALGEAVGTLSSVTASVGPYAI